MSEMHRSFIVVSRTLWYVVVAIKLAGAFTVNCNSRNVPFSGNGLFFSRPISSDVFIKGKQVDALFSRKLSLCSII